MKSAYGLKKDEKLDVSNSLYYGIRFLATKGFKDGVKVEYDNKKGITTTTFTFKGWNSAFNQFNSKKGVKGYADYIKTMVDSSLTPQPKHY
ncbi:MAG: hypothetical protein HYZ42_09570 [Bacteroidetes bacterium]|nr:hypothetical protein [Bacteroidota bacterium]